MDVLLYSSSVKLLLVDFGSFVNNPLVTVGDAATPCMLLLNLLLL